MDEVETKRLADDESYTPRLAAAALEPGIVFADTCSQADFQSEQNVYAIENDNSATSSCSKNRSHHGKCSGNGTSGPKTHLTGRLAAGHGSAASSIRMRDPRVRRIGIAARAASRALSPRTQGLAELRGYWTRVKFSHSWHQACCACGTGDGASTIPMAEHLSLSPKTSSGAITTLFVGSTHVDVEDRA